MYTSDMDPGFDFEDTAYIAHMSGTRCRFFEYGYDEYDVVATFGDLENMPWSYYVVIGT